MQNPLRNEGEAFRLVVATVVILGLTAAASAFGGVWWGLGVFVVLAAAATIYFLRGPGSPPPVKAPMRQSAPGERRILVLANETVGGSALQAAIRERSAGARPSVLVVAPVLSSPLRQLTADEDGARAEAQARLDASVARLRAGGLEARGEVGDSDPLQALEDALRTFGADELVVATHPADESHWLERGVVEEARRRFAVPVTHVVVDPAAGREEVR